MSIADVTEPSPAPRAVGGDTLDTVHLPEVEPGAVLSQVREQARILLAVWAFQAVYLLTIGAALVLAILSVIGLI